MTFWRELEGLFATCNVTLDGPCIVATALPSTSGATTMMYLSSVLVVAIACLPYLI